MKRFKNILLVANFDARQQRAVDRAVSSVKQNDARLTVLSVVRELPTNVRMAVTIMSPEELVEQVIAERWKQVDALIADIGRQGVEANPLVATGAAFLEIIRQVLRDRHDLVVVAAEGRGGLKERLFGSTSMHLMRKCPCPVWVVKPAKRTAYKRILAAVDLNDDFPDDERESLNPLILQLASSLARMDGGQLHVVQVWSVFGESYMQARGGLSKKSVRGLRNDTQQRYAGKLESVLKGIDLKGLMTVRHLPRNDDIPRAIVKLAKNKEIDLLVMGTVHRTGLAGFFIGNTAEKVLSEVDCSVLTVKPTGFVTPVTLDAE